MCRVAMPVAHPTIHVSLQPSQAGASNAFRDSPDAGDQAALAGKYAAEIAANKSIVTMRCATRDPRP